MLELKPDVAGEKVIFEIHRHQYIFGPKAVRVNENWTECALPNGWVLSHSRYLSVQDVTDLQGKHWLIVGLAVQCCDQSPDPAQQVAAAQTADVPSLTVTWSGRWILVGEECVYPDASSFLRINIRRTDHAADYDATQPSEDSATERSAVWLSSSLKLLTTLPELPALVSLHEDPVEHEVGFDFYVPPKTAFENIECLLPSQNFNYLRDEIRLDQRLANAINPIEDTDGAYDAQLDRIGGYKVTVLRNLHKTLPSNGQLWFSLSAGYDTRSNLAAAVAANIPFKIYTHNRAGQSSPVDTEISRELGRKIGIDANIIRDEPPDQILLDHFDAHYASDAFTVERLHIAHGMWSQFSATDLIVRGATYLAVKPKWRRGIDKNWLSLSSEEIAQRIAAIVGSLESPHQLRRIATLIDWIKETPIENYDWRDRFTVEARGCGYTSAKELALDGLASKRFEPINSHAMIAAYLSCPYARREHERTQIDVIARLAPGLEKIPFNPPEKFTLRLRKVCLKAIRIVRGRGLLNTCSWAFNGLKKKLAN